MSSGRGKSQFIPGTSGHRLFFKTLTSAQYSNNVIAFLTAGLRFKSSIYRLGVLRVNYLRTNLVYTYRTMAGAT